MQRLIKDASQMIDIQKELGVTVDASSLSFDNIVNAISVMQKKLDIAGTSAKESTETIQGSIARMGAAWDNFIVGLGNKEADIGKLTKDLISTLAGGVDEAGNQVKGVIQNIVPVIETVVKSLPDVISTIGQALASELPKLTQTLLPSFVSAVTNLILEFTKLLPTLVPAVLDALKETVVEIGKQLPALLETLTEFIESDTSLFVDAIVEIAMLLIDTLTNPDVIVGLVDAALKLIVGLGEGLIAAIPKLVEKIPVIIENLIKALLNSIPKIIEAGIQLFTSLVSNLPAIISGIIQAIPQILTAIWDALNPFGPEMSRIFSSAWEGIKHIFSLERVGAFFEGVWDGIQKAFSHVTDWFGKVFSDAWEGIKKVFSATGETFSNIGKSIVNALSTVINAIIAGINQVIRLPIDALNTILRIIHDINIFGLKPFEWIGQIPVPQIPSIPMLAEGGILKRGQIALLEGQGDEAVIPLSRNLEWIDNVAERLSDKIDGNTTYNFTIHIANMNANDQSEIEQLAERLMEVMSEKTARRRNAF